MIQCRSYLHYEAMIGTALALCIIIYKSDYCQIIFLKNKT